MSKDVNKLLAGQLLIVEDDAITSELISNNLTALKKIRIVANGKSAVKFCQLYKKSCTQTNDSKSISLIIVHVLRQTRACTC